MADLSLDDINMEELYDWDEQPVATHTPEARAVPTQNSEPSTSENSGPQQKKAQKSKAKKPVFNMKLDDERISEVSIDITKAALDKAQQDPKFQMKYGYGLEVRDVAHQISVKGSDGEQFEEFAMEMVSKVAESVYAGEGAISNKAQELIWTEFHRIRTNVDNKRKWSSFLISVGVKTQDIVSSLLYQYILRSILGELISLQCTKIEGEEKKVPPKHRDHDMQVLRYIAGFIPFSLLKRYKKTKSEQARNYTKILKEWQLNDDNIVAPSFLAYTVTWINLQNRGGLFKVHDDVFRFFLTLEKVSGSLLQTQNLTKLNSTNLNQIIKKKITGNPNVSRTWNDITSTDAVSTKSLFNAVVSKWIKLRVNAFVKAFNILKKQQKQASKKGEKSLRKELQK